mmetsp:Transcript_27226/g.55787  ORF Transcript_27226/g.55787 Transcript_27226/m.55787 type:complete len:115 (-) Transcript_27226:1081-1425(-)
MIISLFLQRHPLTSRNCCQQRTLFDIIHRLKLTFDEFLSAHGTALSDDDINACLYYGYRSTQFGLGTKLLIMNSGDNKQYICLKKTFGWEKFGKYFHTPSILQSHHVHDSNRQH